MKPLLMLSLIVFSLLNLSGAFGVVTLENSTTVI
jgi:hypothetical protein